jgi:hypothetical protein
MWQMKYCTLILLLISASDVLAQACDLAAVQAAQARIANAINTKFAQAPRPSDAELSSRMNKHTVEIDDLQSELNFALKNNDSVDEAMDAFVNSHVGVAEAHRLMNRPLDSGRHYLEAMDAQRAIESYGSSNVPAAQVLTEIDLLLANVRKQADGPLKTAQLNAIEAAQVHFRRAAPDVVTQTGVSDLTTRADHLRRQFAGGQNSPELVAEFRRTHDQLGNDLRKLAKQDPENYVRATRHYILSGGEDRASMTISKAVSTGHMTPQQAREFLDQMAREVGEMTNNPLRAQHSSVIRDLQQQFPSTTAPTSPAPGLVINSAPPAPAAVTAPARPTTSTAAAGPTTRTPARALPEWPATGPYAATHKGEFLPGLSQVEAYKEANRLASAGNPEEAARHFFSYDKNWSLDNQNFSNAMQMSLRVQGQASMKLVEVMNPQEINTFVGSMGTWKGILAGAKGSGERANFERLLRFLREPKNYDKLHGPQQNYIRKLNEYLQQDQLDHGLKNLNL